MPDLKTFLEAARRRVANGAYRLVGEPLLSNGKLSTAIRMHPTPIVAELKPRSPSEGDLLAPRQPSDVLAAYREGGAAALSVLADGTFFGGSPTLVRQAHEQGLPVLFKDFVVDEIQVTCARHVGASAILLIERAFAGRPAQRERLVRFAHANGLEVLLEVFDDLDWASAKASKADLVGVNARDLETLHVDAARSLPLLTKVARSHPVLALSGIKDRASYRAALTAGAAGALVGTSLMRSVDPGLALRALQRPLAKLCGLRDADDVTFAASSGADLIGFVVASPGSPREVPIERAKALVSQARGEGLRTVLVTRAKDLAVVTNAAAIVRPDFVQLHGLRPTAAIRRLLLPVRLLASLAPGSAPPIECDGFVLDTSPEGGTGRVHDWQRAPEGFTLVAGGLDADNAAAALAATHAWGADASSGLESSPGRKDPARVHAFVQAVHAA